MIPVSILLVEDDPLILRVMRYVLEKNSYGVVTAGSQEEAVAAFERNPGVRLLVADVNLTAGSGIDLARALLERNPNLKIVLTSGWGNGVTEELGDSSVEHVFVAKPFTASQFFSAVREALSCEDPPSQWSRSANV